VKLVLHADAGDELDQAAAWYDDQRAGLGDRLLAEMRDALAAIAAAPNTWPRWPDTPALVPPIRRFVIPRFPYAIAYQVYPEQVVVLAIAHSSRRPLYWLERVAGDGQATR
jgi:toxin ParE1/3/4